MNSNADYLQYADVPPEGYRLRRFRGDSAQEGDMAFYAPEGVWRRVIAGENVVGADVASLWHTGILALAVRKPAGA